MTCLRMARVLSANFALASHVSIAAFEGLGSDHPAFLVLLFERGRDALENGFARVQ